MSAIEDLRGRVAELADLAAVESLASWDQLVMMPSEGAGARSQQLGTLARLAHGRATAEEIGGWLAELEQAELSDLDSDIVRLAARDWQRARRVPADLAAEMSRAHAEGQESWQLARANNDFALFAPALERNVELARAYGDCLAEDGGSRYEALLSDYDYGLKTAEVRRLFTELSAALGPLVGEASGRSPRVELSVPVAAQQAAVAGTLRRLGVDQASWRVDVSAHPFTSWM
ncbi:MAG: carboxypeptidase, partial [Solirubrobacterales bacterium]|nr:carboxypeptidase [Solirubrobacterales bacterium]